MNGLLEALEDNWQPERVILSCSICDSVLFDSKKDRVSISEPKYLTSLIDSYARSHEDSTGHAEVDVGIDKTPVMEREIDCTVTVN